MEEILAHLLVPDNDSIVQATDALREAFRRQDAVPALCSVLTSSQSPQIRQYAAVVLRKRLTKPKYWNKLPPEVRDGVKLGILPVLINEKEKAVKSAVVQFIGVIAKHEMNQGAWPDLQKLLHTLITSQAQADVELGMFIMSVLTDISLDIFANQTDNFVFLFSHTMNSLEDLTTVLGYYTVVTMTHTVTLASKDQNLRNVYLRAIPMIMKSVPALIAADEDKAITVLDLFTEILTNVIQLLLAHLGPFIQFCLEIGSKKEFPIPIRDKAFCLVGSICRSRKKLVVKQNLLRPIVDILFTTMCEPPEEGQEEEEDWFSDEEINSAAQSATHVLGGLAIYLPPNKLLEHVVGHVTVGLQTNNEFVRRASYYALGIVTEGASECIRNKHLPAYIQFIRGGITDNSSGLVRNSALFALGQIAEHLQPDVSEYAEELMPILFEYLSHLCRRLEKKSQEPREVYGMFYALESFCENLEEKLVPYLPILIERILLTLNPNHCVSVQELALSTLGSITASVKADILPFFPTIIEKLKIYLLEQHTEETACLQVQALQTFALLARTIGPEHFAPLTEETLALALKLLQQGDDPDLKRATYCLFAAMSAVLKEQSATFIPILYESLMLTLRSTDGFVVHYKDEENTFPVYEDLSDTADEEDIEAESDASSEVGDVAVENPYMDEKEEAIITIKELAINTGSAFYPYLEESYAEVFKLATYPYEDVRKSSYYTLAHLCVALTKSDKADQAKVDTAIVAFVGRCCDTSRHDDEIFVVNAALESLNIVIKELSARALQPIRLLESLVKTINKVMLKKTHCQDRDEEGDEDDEGEAEQDEVLMGTAGELLPEIGRALPADTFVRLLLPLIPTIRSKLSKGASTAQKSFFIGLLAECMTPAADELQKRENFCLELLAMFKGLMHDKQRDVRNNAIFGLGELVLHGKHNLFPQYMNILMDLSNALSQETEGLVIDNICGALARLVISNVELVPMEQVFPVFLEKLPLREDFDEHIIVIKCFGHLYQLGHPAILAHMSSVIRICCLILIAEKQKEETLQMDIELLTSCRKDFPGEMSTVLQSFSPAEASRITSLLPS